LSFFVVLCSGAYVLTLGLVPAGQGDGMEGTCVLELDEDDHNTIAQCSEQEFHTFMLAWGAHMHKHMSSAYGALEDFCSNKGKAHVAVFQAWTRWLLSDGPGSVPLVTEADKRFKPLSQKVDATVGMMIPNGVCASCLMLLGRCVALVSSTIFRILTSYGLQLLLLSFGDGCCMHARHMYCQLTRAIISAVWHKGGSNPTSSWRVVAFLFVGSEMAGQYSFHEQWNSIAILAWAYGELSPVVVSQVNFCHVFYSYQTFCFFVQCAANALRSSL
jgi:hypothetical protein